MIFWTLVTLAAATIVTVYIHEGVKWRDWVDAACSAIAAAIIAAVVLGILSLLSLLLPGRELTSETHELRALSSSSTAQGSFFLGTGYVDGERTLNYIAQEEGWARLGEASADSARVFEDSSTPTVTEYTYLSSNGWAVPWTFAVGRAWDFHVPAGSILENYTINND